MGFFDKLKQGLSKTKNSFEEKMNNVFSNFRKVDEDLLEELEEALILSDVGVETSTEIISNLRTRIKKEKIEDAEDVKQALREEIKNIFDSLDNSLHLDTKPAVILVVGVNGVGKTTSIGKMANRLRQDGKKVVVAAADTFRAAAVEQLEIWANRAGCDIVKKEEGVDPASVVFDAIKITKEKNADVLICDTAGRLHNKKYLMDELVKIKKVIDKELPDASKEVFIHYGFGHNWENVNDVKMEKTELGFQAEIELTGTETFNFCFRNENNIWDNNNGQNYVFPLEKVSNELLVLEDEPNFLGSARKLRKSYLWSKKIRLAIYKIITYLPKIISGNYKRKISNIEN